MNNLVGREWKSLSETEKENMLLQASAVDGTTCDTPAESMECIIDLPGEVSVAGYYNHSTGEITVNDDSIIYSPESGIIMSFSDKLKTCFENGITKKQILDVLGIPRNTQLHWEKGERIPPDWQQPLILYALEHINDDKFIKELKKLKPRD